MAGPAGRWRAQSGAGGVSDSDGRDAPGAGPGRVRVSPGRLFALVMTHVAARLLYVIGGRGLRRSGARPPAACRRVSRPRCGPSAAVGFRWGAADSRRVPAAAVSLQRVRGRIVHVRSRGAWQRMTARKARAGLGGVLEQVMEK